MGLRGCDIPLQEISNFDESSRSTSSVPASAERSKARCVLFTIKPSLTMPKARFYNACSAEYSCTGWLVFLRIAPGSDTPRTLGYSTSGDDARPDAQACLDYLRRNRAGLVKGAEQQVELTGADSR